MRFLIFFLLSVSNAVFAADFPINNVQVTVTMLQVWPSNAGAGRYSALVSAVLPVNCPNPKGFIIEAGPGAEAAYSTLLAATLAGKRVEIYLVRCAYYVVADRVRMVL